MFGRGKNTDESELEQCAAVILESGIKFEELRHQFCESYSQLTVHHPLMVSWAQLVIFLHPGSKSQDTVISFQTFFTQFERFIYQNLQQILQNTITKTKIFEAYRQLLQLLANNEVLLFMCYFNHDLAYLTASDSFRSTEFEPALKVIKNNTFHDNADSSNNYSNLLFQATIAVCTDALYNQLKKNFNMYCVELNGHDKSLERWLHLLTMMMGRHDPDLKVHKLIKLFVADQFFHFYGYHCSVQLEGQPRMERIAFPHVQKLTANNNITAAFLQKDITNLTRVAQVTMKKFLHQYRKI
jgi:hypothetical protein